MADSPSRSEAFGPHRTLSARLDHLDSQVQAALVGSGDPEAIAEVLARLEALEDGAAKTYVYDSTAGDYVPAVGRTFIGDVDPGTLGWVLVDNLDTWEDTSA